jgi:uncharacterized protein HemY
LDDQKAAPPCATSSSIRAISRDESDKPTMRINLDKQYDLALGDAIRMADGFFLKEQFAQAKQAYTQIAHHHPRSPHVMHSLGLIAAKQQDHSEAERLLTEAVAGPPACCLTRLRPPQDLADG